MLKYFQIHWGLHAQITLKLWIVIQVLICELRQLEKLVWARVLWKHLPGKNVDLVPVHYQWLRYCKNKNKTLTQFTKCGRHQGFWILENQVFNQQINCYMHLSLLSRSSGVPVGHPSQSSHQRRQKLWKSCLAQKQISRWLFLFTCGGELGDLTIQLYASETESGLQHIIQSAGNRFHICKKIDLAPPSGGAC